MVIRGIKLTGKQPAIIEITPRRDHSRRHHHLFARFTSILEFTHQDHSIGITLMIPGYLRYYCTRINEFRSFACGGYHSELWLMGATYRRSLYLHVARSPGRYR